MDKNVSSESSGSAKKDDGVDYDILPSLLGYHLRRAQIAVFNDFVKTVAAMQITPGQFGVIVLIGSNPGLTQSALARAVGIERSTMVAVIDALESRGLVARRPSPSDRRSNALVLSDAGKDLVDRLKPIVQTHDARVVGALSEAEKEQLIDLLSRITNGAD